MHIPHQLRRSRGLIVSVSVAGLMLSACGSSTTDPTSGEDPGRLLAKQEYLASTCPDLGVDLAGRTMSYWSSWTEQEPQAEVLKHTVKCFEQTTGAKVDVQWLGRSSLTTNVIPALNTNKVPDLVDSDVERLGAALISTDAVQSLEDVLSMKVGEGSKTVKDVLWSKALDVPQGLNGAGEHVFVPTLVFGDAWWYNKDLITDFKAPATIDDLFALFDAAKAKGIAGVAQDVVPFYNAYFFSTLAEKFTGAGGLAAVASDPTGEAWKTEPGLLESAKIVERMAKGYMVDGWDAGKYPQGQNGWADGNAAYNFNGTWLPIEVAAYTEASAGSKAVRFGSFPMPSPDGATHDVVEAQPAGFVIPKKAKNADVAKALIAYSLNKDVLRGFPAMTDNITARPDLQVPEKLKDVQQGFVNADETTIFEDGVGSLAAGAYAAEVFWPADDLLLAGKISAEEFIAKLAEDSKKFWSKQ